MHPYAVWVTLACVKVLAVGPMGREGGEVEVIESLTTNLNGCLASRVDSFSELAVGDQTNAYVILPRDDVEYAAFLMEPDILTSVNMELLFGRERGISKAIKWTNGHGNWALPAGHPRSERKNCFNYTVRVAIEPSVLYSSRKRELFSFYVLHFKYAYLSPDGMIGLSCGYWHPLDACGLTVKKIGLDFNKHLRHGLDVMNSTWGDIITRISSEQTPEIQANQVKQKRGTKKNFDYSSLPVADSVWVIGSQYDFNFHHFISESMTRLIHHYDFIANRPEMKLHILEASTNWYIRMQNSVLGLLNISSDRVITRGILAAHVFVPRAITCASSLRYALELRALAKAFLYFTFNDVFRSQSGPQTLASVLSKWTLGEMHAALLVHHKGKKGATDKKKLVIQQRYSEYVSEDWRAWNNSVTMSLASAFGKAFPSHEVVSVSSEGPLQDCLSCQIREYSTVDVLVGLHGAGLTHVMTMRPGGLVVEIVGRFDGRILPYCGFHGPLGAVFGVHHYVYYYDHLGENNGISEQTAKDIARAAMIFYHEL